MLDDMFLLIVWIALLCLFFALAGAIADTWHKVRKYRDRW